MKIIKMEAANIKKLRAVEITPDGSVVQITGRNGSGKSSVLDAIFWALAGAGAIESEPVRKGEQKAHVRLDMGDVVVTRRFTAAGGTSLVVESADGAVFRSPQTLLDQLLGALSFDPLAFSRMAPKQQLDTLRGVVKLDLDIDALTAANARDYADRTEVNKTVKRLEARLAELDATIRADLDTTPVDVSALLRQMEEASATNTALEQAKREREDTKQWIATARMNAADYRERAARLIEKAEEEERRAAEYEQQLAAAPALGEPVDVAALRQEVEAAQRENAVRDQERQRRKERHDVANQVIGAQHEADTLTQAMERRQAQKAAAIAAAAMPIPGLSFGDGEVLYNGLPLTQASSAEQLRVSVALAMAANPRLRILRVKDGSLLDSDSLALLRDMADANDYQVWIEVVQAEAKVGIHMEDGSIAAVNGAAVEAPADAPEGEMSVVAG